MRGSMMLSLLVVSQIGWGVCATAQSPPVEEGGRLTVIPTAFQELKELRINTGKKTKMRDGTFGAVYVTRTPAPGSTYLNFHVDVASDVGPFVLRAGDVRLERGPAGTAEQAESPAKGAAASAASGPVSYIPMDWFVDSGGEELHGDSLAVSEKALVQFTIEVPEADLGELTLFVRSQRMGTVNEIRERIATELKRRNGDDGN